MSEDNNSESAFKPILPNDSNCGTWDQRMQFIGMYARDHYGWYLNTLEPIEPEIDQYIAEEYLACFSTFPADSGRFDLLRSNQVFHAWKLRSVVVDLLEYVLRGSRDGAGDTISHDRLKNEVDFYFRVLDLHRLVAKHFEWYCESDQRKARPTLPHDIEQGRLIAFKEGETPTIVRFLAGYAISEATNKGLDHFFGLKRIKMIAAGLR
jgi:hypothetical protein